MVIQAKRFIDSIANSLDVEYDAGFRRWLDYPFHGVWKSSSYSVFTLVAAGCVRTVIKDSGLVLERPEGLACYLPAGVYRKTDIISTSGADVIISRMRFHIFHGVNVLSFFDVPWLFDQDISVEINRINRALCELDLSDCATSIGMQAKCKALCFELLHLVLSASQVKKSSLQNFFELERLSPVIEYISAHYREDISSETLAREAGLSVSRFYHKFKEIIGIAPRVYIRRFRIREARHLLLHTDLSIAEAGEMVGWTDQFHFSRSFKKATGFSPLQYRRQYRQGADSLFAD
jgi:AraC-like DNA-binding protein